MLDQTNDIVLSPEDLLAAMKVQAAKNKEIVDQMFEKQEKFLLTSKPKKKK